jgi:peptidoglycan/LPS O-acetylase OafA/YrhL
MLLPLADPAGETIKIVVLFVTFFVLGLACFRTPHAWLPAAFSWTPLRWLGNMSYSYYLIHGVTLLGFFKLAGKVLSPLGPSLALSIGLMPIAFAVTLLSSGLLFLAVERPFSLTASRQRSGRTQRNLATDRSS